MRTAGEIIVSHGDDDLTADLLLIMMKEYATGIIKECAERAKSEWIRYGTNMGHAVDKESILSLIKELK